MEPMEQNTVAVEEETAAADAASAAAEESTADFADGGEGEVQPESEPKKAAEEDGKEREAEQRPPKGQRDANMAQRRREREAEMKKVREDAILQALGHKNPYTGEEMKDSADIEEFLMMQEVEKSGKDPVGDLSSFLKEKERTKRREEQAAREEAEWFRADRSAFEQKYPNVSLQELVENPSFRMFAQGKVAKGTPLAGIYENYLAFTAEVEAAAERKAAQTIANAKASPGSLSGSGQVKSDFFTLDQVRKMTPEQIKANYENIRKSQAKW